MRNLRKEYDTDIKLERLAGEVDSLETRCAALQEALSGDAHLMRGVYRSDRNSTVFSRLTRIENWISKQQTAKYAEACKSCGHVKYDIPEGAQF